MKSLVWRPSVVPMRPGSAAGDVVGLADVVEIEELHHDVMDAAAARLDHGEAVVARIDVEEVRLEGLQDVVAQAEAQHVLVEPAADRRRSSRAGRHGPCRACPCGSPRSAGPARTACPMSRRRERPPAGCRPGPRRRCRRARRAGPPAPPAAARRQPWPPPAGRPAHRVRLRPRPPSRTRSAPSPRRRPRCAACGRPCGT